MTFHSQPYSRDDVCGWRFAVVGLGLFLKLIWGKGLGFINEDLPKLIPALIAMRSGNSRQTLRGGV